MGKRRRKRVECPNCQKQLREEMNYCFNCGQENHVKRVSMKMLTADFVSTYFSADSKLFSSLKYLITRPSFLSLEYLNGKIEAYLRPIRLYVFISFAFFLLFNLTTSFEPEKDFKVTVNKQAVTVGEIDNDKVLFEEEGQIEEKVRAIFSDSREKALFLNYAKSKLPILIFILIPVLAGLLYVFFYKKTYYYIDHLVFALHLQSFLFIALIITTLIDWIFNTDVGEFAFLALLIYGFIAAKRFYKRKRISTFFRLLGVGFVHVFMTSLFLLGFFFILLKSYSI